MKTNKEIAYKILDKIHVSAQLSEIEMIRIMSDFESYILEALRLKDEEVKQVIRDWIREHHDMHMQKKSMGDITCVYALEEYLSKRFPAGSDEVKA